MPLKSSVMFMAACLIAAAMPRLSARPAPAPDSGQPAWPTHFEGRVLQRLPLSALELRFMENFPGRIARFSDGKREIVMRWVSEETRKLHPAMDCFKGSGYQVTPQPIEVDSSGVRWGSFMATRGAKTANVRERIYDSAGNNWTDVSSWYWAAFRERSRGPWWAVTVAQHRLPPAAEN